MPRFRYVAHTMAGQRIMGEEIAVDEAALVRILQGRDLFIARVAMAGSELKMDVVKKSHLKVRDEDRLFFARELATLLDSGVPFDAALDMVAGQIASVQLAKVLAQVREDVNAGISFHAALVKHPKSIPVLWSHLIEAGEVSGDIVGVLRRIGGQLEQTMTLKKKVVSALVYPAILIVMTIAAVGVFLLFVIPAFAKVFESMNAKLPAMTSAILSTSTVAKTYFIPVAATLALAAYILKKYAEIPAGRRAMDLWLVRLPVLGGLVREVVLARIAINLSVVLSSGVGIIYGLDVVSRACGNKIYEEALENVMEDVRDGASLSQAMGKRAVFSSLMLQMVAVGEESGKLPETIQKVAAYYEARVDTLVSRIGTLVEPVVLIFLGAVIGVIVIALVLPIVTISSAIR